MKANQVIGGVVTIIVLIGIVGGVLFFVGALGAWNKTTTTAVSEAEETPIDLSSFPRGTRVDRLGDTGTTSILVPGRIRSVNIEPREFKGVPLNGPKPE